MCLSVNTGTKAMKTLLCNVRILYNTTFLTSLSLLLCLLLLLGWLPGW